MKLNKNILYSLAASALITVIIAAGILERPDRWLQDMLFQHPGVPSRDIVIIGIDEASFEELGPYQTWDRNVIAKALEALASDPDNKPAVTAIDVLYAGHTSEQADTRLANAAKSLGNVVTASIAEFGEEITWENGHATSINNSAVIYYDEPYTELAECTTIGHINAISDIDSVMRHALLYVDTEDGRVYSLSSEVARLYRESRGEEFKLPPVNDSGYFYIPFTAKQGDYYDGVSIASLINGEIPSDYWAGKIVLIGPYAIAFQDQYFTPIDKGVQMYGVEIHANLIQCMLESNYKTEVAALPQLLLLFAICAAATWFFLEKKVRIGACVCAACVIVSAAATFLLYIAGLITHPLWLPIAVPVCFVLALGIHYIRAAKERQALMLEKERIATELELATRIQISALPKEIPNQPEFNLFASMVPAKEVGGDFYDYYPIDDDHWAFVIADVSGKGIPGALFMMVTSALIHHVAVSSAETDPAKVLRKVNAEICLRNPEEMFITVWLGILELSTGKLSAANAGHEYPILKKAGENFELLKDRHGLVIGAMEGVKYRSYEVQMEPGAKLFVYTDGIAEATNIHNELFGTERLVEVLQAHSDAAPSEILHEVDAAVNRFVGEAPQFDDMTMLCIEYRG
ncbi:MAG: SpoIIE family protein phosphatase [Lachnospiraceae bacterium]|nr:SpoIIE family protein phosphatase [Lachnospiraceae bacterium]